VFTGRKAAIVKRSPLAPNWFKGHECVEFAFPLSIKGKVKVVLALFFN
jgi:hypothetical protein